MCGEVNLPKWFQLSCKYSIIEAPDRSTILSLLKRYLHFSEMQPFVVYKSAQLTKIVLPRAEVKSLLLYFASSSYLGSASFSAQIHTFLSTFFENCGVLVRSILRPVTSLRWKCRNAHVIKGRKNEGKFLL